MRGPLKPGRTGPPGNLGLARWAATLNVEVGQMKTTGDRHFIFSTVQNGVNY